MSDSKAETETDLGTYCVVMRTRSRVVVDPGERVSINVRSPWGTVRLTVYSLHVDEGYKELVPRELAIEALGVAPSLNEAVSGFYDAARPFAPIVAFCANASVGLLEPHLAWDATGGRPEREFLEVYLKDERGLPLPGRRLKMDAAQALLDRISSLPDDQIAPLVGVISRYGVALDNWYLGGETAALPYLWFAAEALAKLVVHAETSRRSPEEVADKYGMPRDGGVAIRKLEGFMRRAYVFDGDETLHGDVKDVSDGLEHGSLPLHEAHPKTAALTPALFTTLRKSILRFIEPDGTATADLNAALSALPLDTIQRRIIRGRFVNVEDELAHPSQLYPVLEWRVTTDTITRDDAGDYNMIFTDKVTVRCAPGVEFKAESIEIRGRPDGSTGSPPTVASTSWQDAPAETARDRTMPVLTSVARAFKDLGPGEAGSEVSQLEAHILDLHNLTRGLYSACHKLMAAGLAEEALILGRSLFLQGMRFKQLMAASSDARIALAIGWRHSSATDLLALLGGIDALEPQDQTKAEDRLDEIMQAGRRLGVTELDAFDDAETIAADLDDAEYLRTHRIAALIEAGSDIGGISRRIEDDEGRMQLHNAAADSWLYPSAARYIATSALIALRGATALLAWTDTDGALLAVEKALDELETAGGN